MRNLDQRELVNINGGKDDPGLAAYLIGAYVGYQYQTAVNAWNAFVAWDASLEGSTL